MSEGKFSRWVRRGVVGLSLFMSPEGQNINQPEKSHKVQAESRKDSEKGENGSMHKRTISTRSNIENAKGEPDRKENAGDILRDIKKSYWKEIEKMEQDEPFDVPVINLGPPDKAPISDAQLKSSNNFQKFYIDTPEVYKGWVLEGTELYRKSPEDATVYFLRRKRRGGILIDRPIQIIVENDGSFTVYAAGKIEGDNDVSGDINVNTIEELKRIILKRIEELEKEN